MNNNEEWKLAAKWFDQCGCLPDSLKTKLINKTLTLKDFGLELRNGVILCNMLNYLMPNSINMSLVAKHSKSSRVMSSYNIGLFEEACIFFELNELIQIDTDKLYDLDLSQILQVLSLLSVCPASIQKGFTGFYIDSENSLQLTATPTLSDDTTKDTESIYAPATFFINSNTEAILDVYDKINEHYKSSTSKAKNLFKLSHHATIKKTDHILRELLLTEESYLNMLNSLQNDYLLPLSKILNHENNKCISINIDILLKFHNLLYYKLLEACEGGKGRTIRICKIFLSFKKQFVEKYSYYFENIDNALEKITVLSTSDITFKKLIDEGQHRNSFSLTDLLVQPFQRMTKYHLFFKEIFSKADDKTDSKQLFKKTWEAMEEICKYLNQCKKDQDNLNKINFLIGTLASFKLKTELNLKQFGRFLKDENLRKIKISHTLLEKERGQLVESISEKCLLPISEKDNGKKIIFLFEKAIIIISKFFNSYSYIDTIPIEDYLTSENGPVSHVLFEKSISMDSTTSSKASTNDSSNVLSLHNPYNNKSYIFYFKTLEQRNEWKELFNIIKPADLRHHNHKFTLKNFERNIIECNFCKKYLNGIFFQGYKCEYCLQVVHRECLEKSKPCEVSLTLVDNQQDCSIEPHKEKKKEIIKNETLQRARSTPAHSIFSISAADVFKPINKFKWAEEKKEPEFKIFKAIESFSGENNDSDKKPILSFNKGDYIYIKEESENKSDWLTGYKLNFSIHHNKISTLQNDIFKQKGYIQKKLLAKIDMMTDLGIYSWYLECDKKLAILILERIILSIRIQNKLTTFFMVRFRKEAGYAISLCFNNKIRHIKINSREKSDAVEYSIDNERYFSSIVELVNFFSNHTLAEYFSDINSNLGKPYRQVLPDPNQLCLSNNEYFPAQNYLENKNQEIWLKKGHLYFLLEEFEYWSYVFDTNGLLGYVPKNLLKN